MGYRLKIKALLKLYSTKIKWKSLIHKILKETSQKNREPFFDSQFPKNASTPPLFPSTLYSITLNKIRGHGFAISCSQYLQKLLVPRLICCYVTARISWTLITSLHLYSHVRLERKKTHRQAQTFSSLIETFSLC